MKLKIKLIAVAFFLTTSLFSQVALAETPAEFKAKLLKMAGPLGPFATSEDFPKSYFLITKNLPFMVGLALVHPMKKELGLSKEQIDKIKKIKKTTVPVVIKISTKIKKKELALANQFIAGATVAEMEKVVDEIASLRVGLTKKHLVCIDEVRAILTSEQLKTMINYASKTP